MEGMVVFGERGRQNNPKYTRCDKHTTSTYLDDKR